MGLRRGWCELIFILRLVCLRAGSIRKDLWLGKRGQNMPVCVSGVGVRNKGRYQPPVRCYLLPGGWEPGGVSPRRRSGSVGPSPGRV